MRAQRRPALGWVLVCSASFLWGCGKDENIAELGEGWNTIKPGGKTICARGDEFQYFVRKGTVN